MGHYYKEKKKRKKGLLLVGLIILVVLLGGWYGTFKKLPVGISKESDWINADDIEFIYDLTYRVDGKQQQEQAIFMKVEQIIDEAEEFIILDMFLFNDDYDRTYAFPNVSENLSKKLVKKKENNPEMPIYIITDEINTFYGVYESDSIQTLKAAGIPVILTDLDKLRNSNTVYSSTYGLFLKWFGTAGKGWINNPFSENSPKVTARSYLRLTNFKANHRKTIVSEKEGMVSSANPHDASSNHSNIAFSVKGSFIKELVESELAVMAFSGYDVELSPEVVESPGEYRVKLITEGRIRETLEDAINKTEKGDQIDIGVFYLSERSIVKSLIKASKREVKIKMVLDANKDAFGMEKIGIPNRPVASELVQKSNESIQIKWYETHGEQFHSKLTAIRYEADEKVLLIGGSANLTRRNINDFNLETNVCIEASTQSVLAEEVDQYFNRIWNNEDGQYTLDYTVFQEDTLWKKVIYRIQEYTGLSTF